jgi:hypothetical protein
VNEHILAAIVTDDEAKTLLRVEEFDDALALADNLGGHSATAAAAKTTAAAATAEAAAATAAEAAAAATVSTAAAAAAAEAAAIAKPATVAEATTVAKATGEASAIFCTETVALVTAATTAVTLTPSIETHGNPNSLVPRNQLTNALGLRRNRPNAQNRSARTERSLHEKWRLS